MKSRMRCWRAVMSDTVLTLLTLARSWLEPMGRNVAPVLGECKHMFDQTLDTEHAFAHPTCMERTYVRRRRTVAVVAAALTAVLMSPLAAGAVRRGGPSAPPAQQVPLEGVVVQPRDTLWSIAQRARPGGHPRDGAGGGPGAPRRSAGAAGGSRGAARRHAVVDRPARAPGRRSARGRGGYRRDQRRGARRAYGGRLARRSARLTGSSCRF